jgi:hypothetical protein
MKTIYTGIFSAYDDLKEPRIVTTGWKYVCYTDQDLTSDTWEIRKVPVIPALGPQRTARKYKILFHRHMEDQYSMYVDGSFLINCNLNEWWEKHFTAPMTCIQHPIRNCVYKEARAVVRNKRKGIENVDEQIEDYDKLLKIPRNNGVIQSGILMRELCPDTIALCEQWWAHLLQYSARDQLAFAAASYEIPVHNTIKWDYRTGKEFVFLGHKKG